MQVQANNIASLILLTLFVQTRSDSDDVLKNVSQSPRTQGRIVKQYAGVKREPIQCTQEGFQADHYDCTIFYQCVLGNRGKYTVFRHQCGPGTIFDTERSICNHPRSTMRSECGGWTIQPNLSTLKNEVDIKEQVVKSISKIEPSKHSLTDSFQAETTKHLSNVISNYQETLKSKELPHPISVKNFIESTQQPIYSFDWTTKVNDTIFHLISKQVLKTTTPTIIKSEQENKHQVKTRIDEICNNEGFVGDSENCHIFYRCVSNNRGGFIRYDYFCSESTIWDDEVQACNHIWAVKKRSCGSRVSGGSNEGKKVKKNDQSSKSGNVQTSYSPKLTQSQTQISNVNVKQNETQINNRNKTGKEPSGVSSHNQSQISYGSAVSQIQTQTDYSDKGSQTQFPFDHKNKSSQSLTLETNSEANPVNQYTRSTQFVSSNENTCYESGFKGVKNDCKKFYRCVENGKGYTKYDYICGEGTVWDSEIESCNHIWAVRDCGGNSNKSTTEGFNASTKTTQSYHTTSTNLPIENNDYGYNDASFENQNVFSTSYTTPLTTMPGNGSHTEESINNKFICKTDGFFGDPKECKKFYRCVDNGKSGFMKYDFICGEGTVWDSNIEACNHAWAVKSCGRYIDSNPNSLSSTTPITNVMTTVSLITVSSSRPTQYEEYDSGYGNPQQENEIPSSTVSSTTKQQHHTSTKKTTAKTSTESTIKTTSPDSISHNLSQLQCRQDGFMGDTNDCRKFYRCVSNDKGGYNKYEFKCGEGTVWDQDIKTCNHDLGNNQCIKSDDVAITSKPVNENDVTQTEFISSSTPIQDNIITTLTNKPQITRDECKSEGFFGNSNDCRKFYRCVDSTEGNYIKYEFECGDGTVWDQEIKACNHNSNDKNCKNFVSVTLEDHSDKGTNNTSTSMISQTSTTSPKENITEVASHNQCTSVGFFANSKDCRKFYRCVNDEKGGYMKYDFTCGEGTIWVQEILACDHDNDINSCKNQNEDMVTDLQSTEVSQETSTTTAAILSTANDHENNEYIHENSSMSPSGKCASDGFYPNEQDCKRFYRCVDNENGSFTKYDFTCGEGTAWDSEIKSCNHISEVKSCQKLNTESSSQSGDDQYLTTTQKSSTLEPNSECSMSSQDTCKQEGYYGNSNNCKKFYRCVDNGKEGLTKFDFTCGEGTIWDQDVLTCNYPQDVANPSCKKECSLTTSSTSQPTSSTLSSTETASTLESTSSNDTVSHNSSLAISSSDSPKDPENQNVTCSHAGFFADPNDCKKFYRCVDWDGTGEKYSVFHFECGDGTIWDPALETCNYEESVYPHRDCGKGHTQNENMTEEGTTKSTTKASTISSSSSTTTQKTTSTTEQSTSQKTSTTTTTEKTTTQETTTTRKTTPSHETTSHQATTESTTTQPITSEQTTTQQLTTTEPSTTQQSTTTESITTQQSTTTEPITTQQTKTDQTTTQQATTEVTTEQTTTETSTTQQSTTQESSTEQSTTEGTTLESTTNQQSTTDGHSESTTENLSSSNECPETNNEQYLLVCPTSFRRHPKYCNLFYQCLEDDDTHEANIATFRCPNNTIYDEKKVQCVEESKADKKCQGQIARRLKIKFKSGTNLKEPIVVDREGYSCTNEGHLPFEKQYECSTAFLKCQKTQSGDIKGFVYQCPPGYVYWSISRRCESSRKIFNCRRSSNDWAGRWSLPIERTNIAA